HFQSAHTITCRNSIGQFIEGPLLGREHHRLNIAKRDSLLLANIENQLFELVRNHHHVTAKRIDQFTSSVGFDLHFAGTAVLLDPAHGIAFFNAAKFHDRAIASHGFADALVTFLVGQVYAASICGNADVVGNENQHSVGI